MKLKAFSRVMLVISIIYLVIAAVQAGIYFFVIPSMFPNVSHGDIVKDMATQPGVGPLQLWMFEHIHSVLMFNLLFAVLLTMICYGFDRQRRWGLQSMIGLMWVQLLSCVGGLVAPFFAPDPFSATSILSLLFTVAVGIFSAWVIRYLRRPEIRASFR